MIWPADEAVIASDEYELPEYLPGYFAFGGNGGGELFVFAVDRPDSPVFMVPAMGMSLENIIAIADNFTAFARMMSPRT